MSIVVSKIDVEVANFSLKDKFHFSVAGAILGNSKTHIEGQAIGFNKLQAVWRGQNSRGFIAAAAR